MSEAPDRQLKALVTGAAREGGIGRAIVERLEADGLEVVTIDKAPGCTYQADLVHDELPDFSDIDVLVCNAAITTMFGAAHSMKLERWQIDLDVNLTGTFRTVQACLPGMRERRFGRIVIIGSTAGVHGMPAQIAYSTSKAGLLGLSKTVAAENVTLGITCNVVLPGMTASAGMLDAKPEVIEAWARTMPLGELVRTQDIAEAVAFFASPAASRVTGQELTVDGGHALNTKSVTSSVVQATAAS
jgi:acetoacetyl-CoA reductase